MARYRIKLRTDIEVYNAISGGKRRMDSVPPEQIVYNSETQGLINSTFLLLNEKSNAIKITASAAAELVVECKKTSARLRQLCSHYLQILNFKIAEKKLPPGVRALYGITIKRGNMPKMISGGMLQVRAAKISSGAAALDAAGYPPITDVSAEDVQILLNEYLEKIANKLTAQNAAQNAQTNLKNLRKEAKKLAKNMWDETEFYFRNYKKSTRRKLCEGWGVKYFTGKKISLICLLAVDEETLQPLPGIKFRIGNLQTKRGKPSMLGVKNVTNLLGYTELKTSVAGNTFLISEALGYDKKIIPLKIKKAGTLSLTIKIKKLN